LSSIAPNALTLVNSARYLLALRTDRGTGADTCAATGSCSGDGGCVPICPPVDLLEDEDDEDIDL
jgi:hypothetical protein